ncbi:MAG: 5'-deoxynucleotidase [Clostridia bacterium]
MYKFFAFLGRMKLINRWSLMRSTSSENIAEHSCSVAIVAHALATISNVYFGGNCSADSIAVRALFHESSEVLTGDLPTPIKYYNEQINSAYKDIESQANAKLISLLPEELKATYDDIINYDHQEYKFVKYADKICAYIKCVEECRQGNKEFIFAKQNISQIISDYNCQEVDYFMQNFVVAYELSLDELS